MTITAALLESALGARRDLAELYAPHLATACAAYEITTPLRLAHFLAQVGHETKSLIHAREIWGPTPTPAQERYERNFAAPWPETPTEARRAEFAVNRLAYSLGNEQAGDGKRYSGHGLIQTTGRGNHRAVRDRLRARGIDAPDFEAAPELLERPRWAALSAADYWGMRNINALADADDHEAVTRAVNGGTNGIEDRRRRLVRAKDALGSAQEAPTPAPTSAPTPPPPAPPAREPWQSDDPGQHSQEAGMPIPIAPIVTALAPAFLEMLPKLGAWFGSGSKSSERNMAVVGEAIKLAQTTAGAVNALDAVEKMKADPAVRAQVEQAVEANWYMLTEAGGGGIAGARAADVAAVSSDGPWWQVLRSPSFLMAIPLLGLVYIIVLSLVGVLGNAEWSQELRGALAGTITGAVVGGLVGYYYGQMTSRNRTA